MKSKINPVFFYFLFLYFCLNTPYSLSAQIDVGVSIATSNLLGDFGGGAGRGTVFSKDIDIESFELAAGAFIRYNLNSRFGIRGQLLFGQFSSDDRYSEERGRFERGLQSQSPFLDFSLTGEFNLFPIRLCENKNSFSPYIGLGIGAYRINPTLSHHTLPLEDLGAQQAYIEQNIQHFGHVIPMNFGLKYNIGQQLLLSGELMYRFTFSDHLDGYTIQQNDEYFLIALNASYFFCPSSVGYAKLKSLKVKCPRF